MPLSLAPVGEEHKIVRLAGNDKQRCHLADLGFNTGETVRVISAMGGNLIVSVKDTRIAISVEMANKIIIQ